MTINLSQLGLKHLKTFAIVYPEICDKFYVKIGRRASIKGLILLFLVGLGQHFNTENRDSVYSAEVTQLYRLLVREISTKYNISFSMDRSNINKTLSYLYKEGYLHRDLVDIESKGAITKTYAYSLTPKGETVFNGIINFLLTKQETSSVYKAYVSEKEKEEKKLLAEVEEKEPTIDLEVEERFTYFESEKDFENIVLWAYNDLYKMHNPAKTSRLQQEKILLDFYDEGRFSFGMKFRKSIFLRWDSHFFYTAGGQTYGKPLKEIVKNIKRGIKDVLLFIDPDLVEDPMKTWVRMSSIVTSIVNESIKIKIREGHKDAELVDNVLPTFLVLPKDSRFYQAYKNVFEKYYNAIEKIFVAEGVPINILGYKIVEFGNVYICEDNHIYWATPKEIEPTRCPFCGKPFQRMNKVNLTLVEVDFALKDALDILHVYIPADLYYFIQEHTNLAAGFIQLLLIDATEYLPAKGKNLTLLAIGYFPSISRMKIDEKDEHFIRNELAKRKTWEILYDLSQAVFQDIVGYEHAKVASLLISFSQTYKRIKKLAVPNVVKARIDADPYDYSYPPAPLYALFVGKPGTGKSTIAKLTLLNANPALGIYAYVNLKRASIAGITATSAVAPGSKRKIYLGIERAAHGTMIIYDEIDKASDSSLLQSIADTMSEGFFTYDKAYASMLRELAISAKILVANDHRPLEEEFTSFPELYDYLMNPQDIPKEQRTFRGFVANVIDRFDLIIYFPKLYDSTKLIELHLNAPIYYSNPKEVEYIAKIFREYVYLVRHFSNHTSFYIRKDAVEALYEYLSFIKEEDPDLFKYLASTRRLDTIYKIARTIAAMHFRNEITIEDIKEALAFLIFCITYPFAYAYLKILQYFKEELGVFYHYAEAVANNKEIYKVIYIPEEKTKITIRSRAELARYVKSILATWEDEFITIDQLMNVVMENIQSGKVKIEPLKSWRINPPFENTVKDELKRILDKLEMEGVLLLDNPKGIYKINKNLL